MVRPAMLVGLGRRMHSAGFWPSQRPRNPPCGITDGGPSGEFGAGANSPRPGSNHPRGGYGRNSTGGWLANGPLGAGGATAAAYMCGGEGWDGLSDGTGRPFPSGQ